MMNLIIKGIKELRTPKTFLHKLYGVMLEFVAPAIRNDEFYLKLKWNHCMNYPLDLKHPKTFNEKLQWLKLHNRMPEYTMMVDKAEVKKYAASIIGEEHIIPTLAVYDRAEDIDFDTLPNQFVLKCTHDSGGIVICSDKSKLNRESAIKKLKKGLVRNYYYQNREWPYKGVKPRIIAEKYMTDDGDELKDYKVFTFDGEPKIVEVDYNRFKGHLRDLYTTEWKKMDATIKYPTDKSRVFDKPAVLKELLDLSRRLSLGTPHLRTDFYIVDDKIFFGELTFFHESGMGQIDPASLDCQMGEWIKLPTDDLGGAIFMKNDIYVFVRIVDESLKNRTDELSDYKFFCFDGEPRFMFIASDRFAKGEETKFDFFDMDFKHLPFTNGHPNATKEIQKPRGFDEMKELAAKLSKDMPHVRVDFYDVNGHIYFGELTFFHWSGMVPFEPIEWDYKFGDLIALPMTKTV